MEFLTGSMSTLLSKLGDLLTDEYKLQKTVRGEIMFLKAEFESMQVALLKISEAPMDHQPDNQVKIWARHVRELSYDVEDRVDKFMVRIDREPKELHGLGGFIDRSLDLLTKARIRHKLSTEIKDLKRSIREVSERRDRYLINQVAAKPADVTVQHLRLAAMYEEAGKLIGTEEKSNKLIGRLMEGDGPSIKKQLKTISIVGFGGLGKTTLAKVVYEKLEMQFDCKAFVIVSQNPNINWIFANMLHQLGHGNHEVTWDTEQLIHELRALLRDRRYLIVIDDIWKTSVWEVIKYALIGNEHGSIVISTTRNLDVAKKIGGVYRLQPLSTTDSTRLFKIRIYGTEEECIPNELTEVSGDILRKCGGVPLAIITIASMLASKEGMEKSHQYWSKVCKTLGSGLENNPDVEKMRRILSVSYYELPLHLKNCMLYLSSYPEDDEIIKRDLIEKWMGEGFIIKEQGKSFYEVAEDYVNELINRSMIQSSHKVYIRVHDMILDLITRLANEDGFLATVDDQQPGYRQERMLRLSLRTSSEEDVKLLSTLNLQHVRSLVNVHPRAFNLLPPLSTFPVLRVLTLKGCQQVVDNSCFENICNLFHLRYLDLCRTGITEIPKEIQKLQLLRLLNINDTRAHELPSTFGRLRNLVCMRASLLNGVPAGFGNLRSLQQLEVDYIRVKSPTVLTNFTGLTELRKAKFWFKKWDKSYVKPFLQCLSSLVSLESLQISGSDCDLSSPCDRLILPGPQQLRSISMCHITVQAVPEWMSALGALTRLYISLSTLGGEGLHVLGNMPSLSHLDIYLDEATEGRDRELVINGACPFCSLRLFKIGEITRVEFGQGVMPKLERLELTFGKLEIMDHLGDLAVGVENLPSLVEVNILLYCLIAYPEKLKAANDTIQNAVAMNKNKPSLCINPMEL